MRFIAALIGSIVAFASADCSLDCLNTCFANGANDCFVTGCGCSETVQAGLKTLIEENTEELNDAKAEVIMSAKGWVAPKVDAVENALNATHSFIENGVSMDM